jgi:hypothetical protein
MKQINSNPIRKQFGPVPIFSIAASIIMAITSGSPLHSQGSGQGSGSLVEGALYFGKEALTDNVLLTRKFSHYSRLYQRKYANSVYNHNCSITSKVNAYNSETIYTHTRTVNRVVNGRIVHIERSSSTFWPTSGVSSQPTNESSLQDEENHSMPKEVPLEVRLSMCQIAPDWSEKITSSFGYRITWKYTDKPMLYWRNSRHFQMTLSNWRNLQISCDEFFKGNGAVFSTKSEIPKDSDIGGEITAQSYVSLFGLVNIDAHDTGDVVFEVINKRP